MADGCVEFPWRPPRREGVARWLFPALPRPVFVVGSHENLNRYWMVMEEEAVASADPSLAESVKLYCPALVGMPVSNPAGFSVSPGGKEPWVTVQVGPGE